MVVAFLKHVLFIYLRYFCRPEFRRGSLPRRDACVSVCLLEGAYDRASLKYEDVKIEMLC